MARKACKAACIGCSKCEKVCKFGAITIENNLSYIDFNKCKLCTKCVDECPTNAIAKLNFPIKKVRPAAPAKPKNTPVEVVASAADVNNNTVAMKEEVKS